ncbi:anti sigma factor C-terminal domain-containing protein [Halalkalibacter urbisdiaboli]|uniref:anti sigma factor C-terminal domain-containing protein n=1 Tax=Halalkalibacter urbisdiaboli TaxID=1960589 RepID=UPI000B437C84|nr:anti sigma factor C-terminal domain-containing protein [Halalkalibacter urbisdiaboli]
MTDREKELDKLFEDTSKGKTPLQQTIKRAKRKTIIRNIFISVFVALFVFVALGFTWLYIMHENQENALRDIQLFSEITSPNVNEAGVQNMGNGIFEGILFINRYKEIGGIPVSWSDNVQTYSLFGGVSRLAGDHSPIHVEDPVDGQIRYYDRETKQRMLEFYHPDVEYQTIRNDLLQLDERMQDKTIEMAISFDKKYKPEEVRALLKDVTLKWYWADTYTDLERLKEVNTQSEEEEEEISIPASPELANQIYGFDEINGGSINSEEAFIEAIKNGIKEKNGKYYGEFERIYHHLKGDSEELHAENVNVLGAVITGTREQLEPLLNQKMVRASVFGVMVESQ